MSCIKDVEKAIVDKIFSEFIKDIPSFRRVNNNFFHITEKVKNKSKNKVEAQKKEIFERLDKAVSIKYDGHARVGIHKYNDSKGNISIMGKVEINPSYIQYIFNTQVNSQQKGDELLSPSMQDPNQEQDQINANTGTNTDADLNPQPEYADPTVGYYVKFVQHKEQVLEDYERRLKLANKELNSKGVTPERLRELNKVKRQLEVELNGVHEIGKKGLRQEIRELKSKANSTAIGYYVEGDLERLGKLSESDNIDELYEAKRIMEFYELAGTFNRDVENPFFTPEDMFLQDEHGILSTDYKITDEDRAQFKLWKDRALDYKNVLIKKFEEVATNMVNTDISVKNTYGDRQFTIDELTYQGKGLKDTSWLDMWTMDITSGILSKNGLLPQVIFSQMAHGLSKELKSARDFEERINHINSKTLKRLAEIGQTLKAKGVDGTTQGVYTIFLEKNKNGQLTGGYAYKYNSTYENEKARVANDFSENFNNAKLVQDYEKRALAFKKAFREKRAWNRANNHILEFQKVPEIQADPEFGEYESHFNRDVATDYRSQMINLIGEKEYNKQVQEQKRLLRKYQADKQSMIDTLMEEQGITNPASLSKENDLALSRWVKSNSPFYGINDYYEVNFDEGSSSGNFQNYNLFVPRRTEAQIKMSEDKRSYTFTSTTKALIENYYNHEFEDHIENDEVLYDFHQVLSEAMDYVKSTASPELAREMAFNYLSTLDKTSSEVITDKANTHNILLRIFPAYKTWWERLRLSFGVTKQNNISFEKLDPITGKPNYKVNDSFLRDNQRTIEEKMLIEQAKFMQAFNTGTSSELTSIKKFTTRKLTSFNLGSLIMLSNYLNIDISLSDLKKGNLEAIRQRTGEDVQLGNIVRDYATHEVIKEQSFDLAKIIKHFTNLAANYAAKSQALPQLNLLKNYYDNISETRTNNIGEAIFNVPNGKNEVEGLRTRGQNQMNNWWERVILENHGEKHTSPFGSAKIKDKNTAKIAALSQQLLNTSLTKEERTNIEDKRNKLINQDKIRTIGKTIYSKEDAKKFAEIEALLDGETKEKLQERLASLNSKLSSPDNMNIGGLTEEKQQVEQKLKLIKIQERLGKTRTATAFINNFLGWIRTLRLGYNLSSMSTNMIEGWFSNMMLASGGDYFNTNEIYYGYHVAKLSFMKNLSFGRLEAPLARKNRMLMDMFDILMDSKNELQKSSVKTFSDKLEKFSPHAGNQRVEYINQSAVMIAMLRSMQIKDKDGNTSSIWDAYDSKANRQLKEEFRTEDNIKNWEDLVGDEYRVFKEKLRKVIVLGHGNYDALRGMMAKSGTAGKALMMFKTWLPQQLYWRFATEQADIQSGSPSFKGKYLSYGTGSAALHGAAIGTLAAGPLGTAIGAGLGGALGHFFGRKGTADDISMIQETLLSAKVLAKKMIGMPVNTLLGRSIIDTSGKEFDTKVGGKFTQQDANALKSNMSDIAIQLILLTTMLATKAAFWDDDDDKDAKERVAHNILVNKLMQLSTQAGMYINPQELYKSTLGSMPVMSYLTEVGKTMIAANEALHGKDTIPTGINKGESKLGNEIKKIALPGLFKDTQAGFESLGQRQFESSPLDKYFKLNIASKRKEMKEQLLEQGDTKGEAMKELNRVLPTKRRLDKAGMTRKQWLKEYGDTQ